MMKRLLTLLSFLFILASHTSVGMASTLPDNSLAPMLKEVMPAIVNVKAQAKASDYNLLRELQRQRDNEEGRKNSPPIPGAMISVASGVIIDAKQGYIVTNAHVINKLPNITITLSDGRHFSAKVIGMDKPSDIALLQIKADHLTEIELADSNHVKVGDFVAAIGSPYGLNQTVTAGIVSAMGRSTLGIENYENFIQTDAPINPGNSGGALLNMQGKLIGINTAILAPNQGSIGIGFAIPSNMMKSVVVQLVQYGDVKRGVLGIGVQDITPDLADAFHLKVSNGAVVTQVLPDSPAQTAGIRVGDIITSVNGSAVKNASDVINTIGFLRVNTKTQMALLRQDKPITVTVTLTDSQKRDEAIEERDPFLYGVGLKNFSQYSPIHGDVKGVLVLSVEEDSNAWHADLRPGDVITSANQQPITSVAQLKAASAKSDKTLLINILRGQGAAFLVISKAQ
jgi:serine protease Do